VESMLTMAGPGTEAHVCLETSYYSNSFSYKWTIRDPVPLLTSYTRSKPFYSPVTEYFVPLIFVRVDRILCPPGHLIPGIFCPRWYALSTWNLFVSGILLAAMAVFHNTVRYDILCRGS